MQKLFFCICCFTLTFMACESNQNSIGVPNGFELDIDEDGNNDFKGVYTQQTTGDPIGNYEEVKLRLESIDGNQILKSEGSGSILFLDDINLIANNVTLPLKWEVTNPSSNISSPLARIRTDYEGIVWNEEWTIFNLVEKNTYLIGFKLANNNQLGYFEFSIDVSNGEFELIKTELL